MAAIRVAGLLLAVVALASTLAGCGEVPAPPAPTTAELPRLVSRAEGDGPDGYSFFGVTLDRFISNEEWPTIMTECVRSHGITNVDFRLLPPGPYTYPADPQGGAALARALDACSLQYPSVSVRETLRTTAQWSYQYSYLKNDFVACIRSAGGLVSSLPSRLSYLDSVESSMAVPSPFAYVTRGPGGAPLAVLKSRCPVIAPGL
ncbi:MAG TPA: hypothetical protein VHZ81_11880 [Galbitalea sp.]|nr:hypothetical protein [Galbitalea sp.]